MTEAEAQLVLDKDIAEAQRRIEKATAKGKGEEEIEEGDIELASMSPSTRTRQFIAAVQAEEEEVLERMARARKLAAEQKARQDEEYVEEDGDEEEYEDDDEGDEEDEEEEAPRGLYGRKSA